MLFGMGDFEAGVESMKGFLKLNPDDFAAHSTLGSILKDLGRFDESEAAHLQATKVKPDEPNCWYNLGVLYEITDLEKAKTAYEKAVECDPEFGDAYYNLGNVLSNLGDTAGAAKAVKNSLKYNPEDQLVDESVNVVRDDCFFHRTVTDEEKRYAWNARRSTLAIIEAKLIFRMVGDHNQKVAVADIFFDWIEPVPFTSDLPLLYRHDTVYSAFNFFVVEMSTILKQHLLCQRLRDFASQPVFRFGNSTSPVFGDSLCPRSVLTSRPQLTLNASKH
jgi:tetratricopeptide (TPR) repeat protein